MQSALRFTLAKVAVSRYYLDGTIALQNATQHVHSANKAGCSVSAGQYSTMT